MLVDRPATSALVDVTHEIAPHDVREGALALEAAAPRSSRPARSTWRWSIPASAPRAAVLAVAARGQVFVGPDNGLLHPVPRRSRWRAFELTEAGVPAAPGEPDVPRARHLRARGRPPRAGRRRWPGSARRCPIPCASPGPRLARARPGRRRGRACRPLRQPRDVDPRGRDRLARVGRRHPGRRRTLPLVRTYGELRRVSGSARGLEQPAGDRRERGERRQDAQGRARDAGRRQSDFVGGGAARGGGRSARRRPFEAGLSAPWEPAFGVGRGVGLCRRPWRPLSEGFSDDFSDCSAFCGTPMDSR